MEMSNLSSSSSSSSSSSTSTDTVIIHMPKANPVLVSTPTPIATSCWQGKKCTLGWYGKINIISASAIFAGAIAWIICARTKSCSSNGVFAGFATLYSGCILLAVSTCIKGFNQPCPETPPQNQNEETL